MELEELLLQGRPKLQRDLGRRIRTAGTERFRQGLQLESRRLVEAAATGADGQGRRSPGASDWLYAVPSHPQLTLHDRFWRAAVALRLRLRLGGHARRCQVSHASTSVTCGAELDPELWHCLGCARQAVQGRHDSLAELWRLAAVEAGCHAAREQLAPELAGPDAVTAQRADVRVEWADGSAPAFYDVVVRTTPHRRGPAYVVDPCGVLVVQAEHDKLRTWGLDALVQPGCRFVPLAVETAGRWGPAAVAELLALARGYEAAGAPADGLLRAAKMNDDDDDDMLLVDV